MNRKQFVRRMIGGSLALSFPNQLVAKKDSHSNPNVILIMADDLGWNELGFMGQQKIKTPNID